MAAIDASPGLRNSEGVNVDKGEGEKGGVSCDQREVFWRRGGLDMGEGWYIGASACDTFGGSSAKLSVGGGGVF